LEQPNYKVNGRGYADVDPEVYFSMFMVGIFEGIESERGIALRCSDTHASRTFLGYGTTKETHWCATLSNMRCRLGLAFYHSVFQRLNTYFAMNGLLECKQLGTDTSVTEANASLCERFATDTLALQG